MENIKILAIHIIQLIVNHTIQNRRNTDQVMKQKSISLLLASTLLIIFGSCSDDNPAGPDLSEAPDAPTLDQVEMDFSVFEDAEYYESFQMNNHEDFNKALQSLQEEHEFSPYEQAALFASTSELWFQSMGQLPKAFFQENQWGDPEVDGDTWTWEWGFAYEGESLAMTVTAETVGEERHWELRYTVEGTDDDVDDALLIASQIHLDGSGGSWQLFDLYEENDAVFEVDYELEDDITTMVEMQFDEEEEGRFQYHRDGDISTLQLWDMVNAGLSTIEWNNETGTGSIESPGYCEGVKVCWNENYEETEC